MGRLDAIDPDLMPLSLRIYESVPFARSGCSNSDGVCDFGALQEALGRHGGSGEMAYIAFDLLHLDGRDFPPLAVS
jgi:hypothetical protein